mgnify:CR=1 FL=1
MNIKNPDKKVSGIFLQILGTNDIKYNEFTHDTNFTFIETTRTHENPGIP